MNKSKAILITGASSGIGRYMVETLTARGHFVFAGYRKAEDANALKLINPEKVQSVWLDVTDDNSVNQVKIEIEKSGRKLDVLINNAGLAIGGPLEALSLIEIRKLYEVNFFGLISVIQTFLPLLRLSQGRIVNISSIAGVFAVPFMVPYSSSKYSVEALSDGLRRELRNQKVKVIMIEPGSLKTPLWRKSIDWSNQALLARPETLTYYQPELDNFIKFLELNVKYADNVSKLRLAIISAVEKTRPQVRYRGYFKNWLLVILIKFSPGKFIDAVFKKFLK